MVPLSLTHHAPSTPGFRVMAWSLLPIPWALRQHGLGDNAPVHPAAMG